MSLLTPEDYLKFPTVAPDHQYPYGSHPTQFAELTLPRTAPPHPVIILIHGGGYREMYDLRPMGSVVAALVESGFAVWNIEYRRHGNGGDYPAMFRDVANAADFLRQIADQHNLNLHRVISMGHSAGGHLALWLAGRQAIKKHSPLHMDDPLPIHGMVALAPLADIKRASEREVCNDALLGVMGGTPVTAPQHYADASPFELLPLGIPQVLIVGSMDTEILDNVSGYIEAAERYRDDARLLVVPEAGHFEIVAVESPAWTEVQNSVCELIDHLGQSCEKN